MTGPNKALQSAAATVEAIGLPLNDFVTEIFEREFRRSMEAQMPSIGGAMARSMVGRRFEKSAIEAVVRRLRLVDLVAAGQRAGSEQDVVSEIILPVAWASLTTEWSSDSARGADVEYLRVRVARAEQLTEVHRRAIRDANRRHATSRNGPGQTSDGAVIGQVVQNQPKVQHSKLKSIGRPSLCDEMEQEMIRRGRRGQMATTLAAEVRALLKIRAGHPDTKSRKKKLPSVGTAMNHLRQKYSALKANPDAQFDFVAKK